MALLLATQERSNPADVANLIFKGIEAAQQGTQIISQAAARGAERNYREQKMVADQISDAQRIRATSEAQGLRNQISQQVANERSLNYEIDRAKKSEELAQARALNQYRSTGGSVPTPPLPNGGSYFVSPATPEGTGPDGMPENGVLPTRMDNGSGPISPVDATPPPLPGDDGLSIESLQAERARLQSANAGPARVDPRAVTANNTRIGQIERSIIALQTQPGKVANVEAQARKNELDVELRERTIDSNVAAAEGRSQKATSDGRVAEATEQERKDKIVADAEAARLRAEELKTKPPGGYMTPSQERQLTEKIVSYDRQLAQDDAARDQRKRFMESPMMAKIPETLREQMADSMSGGKGGPPKIMSQKERNAIESGRSALQSQLNPATTSSSPDAPQGSQSTDTTNGRSGDGVNTVLDWISGG